MSESLRDRAAPETQAVRLVSWGAIFAGVVIALAIQLLLGLFGLGLGFAVVDPANGAPEPTTFFSATGLWTLFVVLAGIFVGAFAAGRLAGSPSSLDGVLHGAVTWSVATLLAVYILTSGVSSAISGTFGALGSSVSGLANLGGQATQAVGSMPDEIDQQLDELLSSATPSQVEPQVQGALNEAGDEVADAAQNAQSEAADAADAAPTVLAGVPADATEAEQQAAIEAIAEVRGVPEQEAASDLATLRERYVELQQQATQAAEEAADYASTAAFSAAVVLFLGLLAGALGGLVGRPKVVRV